MKYAALGAVVARMSSIVVVKQDAHAVAQLASKHKHLPTTM